MTRFVLVPGAGGDPWYWHLVVPLLEDAGHEAVPVDLPGGDPDAGLEAYASIIAAAADGADDVVLVAQSMGGLSAPLAAERVGAREIVLVNAMVPASGETGGTWWSATGRQEAADALAVAQGRPTAFDPLTVFFHDLPEAVVAAAEARGEPPQGDRPFHDPWPLEAWPAVPTRAVVGRDDRLFPAEFQTRVLRERLGLAPVLIDGGHLVALSRPDALVDVLLSGNRSPVDRNG